MSQISCAGLCAVIDRLETGVIVLDAESRIVHWNRWTALRSQIDSPAANARLLTELWPEIAHSRLQEAIRHAVEDGLPSLLSPALHGTVLPLYRDPGDRRLNRRMQQMIHVLPVREPGGMAGCIIQITDMTANISRERLLRQQAEALRRSTSEDPLTGLLNRRKFEETLATEFRKAQQRGTALALLIADIDLFASYNALYGREHGDHILSELASMLKGALRPAGDFAGRFGGEEFAFLCTDVTPDAVMAFADNLRLRVAASQIPHAGSPLTPQQLTISVGCALMRPDAESDTHTLVSSADVALYQAKHEGRNRAMYFSIEDGNFKACG